MLQIWPKFEALLFCSWEPQSPNPDQVQWFHPNMLRPLLNHAPLAVAVGLTFLSFRCTLCNTIDINYSTPPAHLILVSIPPSFQPWKTLALLFGYQWPPLAPNIVVFHCTECCTTVNDYSPNLAFLPRMTLALLFGCQWPPSAPNNAVFHCTERCLTVNDYSPNLALSNLVITPPLLPTRIITLVTISPSFLSRMTLALLFGS